MTKIRRNHGSNQRGSSSGHISRLGIFLVAIVIGIVLIGYSLRNGGADKTRTPAGYVPAPHQRGDSQGRASATDGGSSLTDRDIILPSGGRYEVIHHRHYSLGYDESAEQAAWVAYPLTAESIYVPNVKRSNWFTSDSLVSTRSAKHSDYTRSGYTRGHLAPAGDMAFNREAMRESFKMSNMSPQLAVFNAGVWKELEENVRDWAIKRKELYVVTGPILKGNEKRIGKKTKIAVPEAFYKVLLDVNGSDHEGIAYVVPHRLCTETLDAFATSIDEVEELTGLDFFAQLPESTAEIEANYDASAWRLDTKRYKDRLKNGNKSQ